MKKVFMSGVLAVALAALASLPATAAGQGDRLWSIVVHLGYEDGTEYDVVVASGVTTREVAARLAECGQGHRGGAGAVVSFHCYPVPE
jgi:hypothetical protein